MPRSIDSILEHPVARALNPANKKFMRADWLSERINPVAEYGIDVAAVSPFHEFGHLKVPPAFEMMLADYQKGIYEGKHTLIIPSSGNTGLGGARLAPVFGFKRTKVIVPSDMPPIKRLVLEQTPWTEVIPAGGAGRSTEDLVAEHAQLDGHHVLDQYKHFANMLAHFLHTGPEIFRACGGYLDLIVISMGSGGTAAGVGQYVQKYSPYTRVIGVRPVLGQQVPGTRDEKRMAEVVTLPWRTYVADVVEGERKDSFIMMRQLASELEPAPGPSSGLAFVGLRNWMQALSPAEVFPRNLKRVAVVCPDQSWPYAERETGELDPGQGMVTIQ